MSMQLTHEDAISIECFRERAKALLEQGKNREARILNMYALQIINRTVVDVMSSKSAQKGESLLYSDLSMTVPGPDFKSNVTILELGLATGSPLYQDILKVLEAHKNDDLRDK